MKLCSLPLVTFLASTGHALAYPRSNSPDGEWIQNHIARARAASQQRDNDLSPRAAIGSVGGGLVNGVLQPLTGALQGVDVPTPQPFGLTIIPDAAHPYQPPPPGSVRGMCPTMNTLANHGYINRSGITTFAEAANACQTAFGFAYDICVFLSAVGLFAGGDLSTGKMSIGGQDGRVPNSVGPSLGLSHHGPFECDASITRQDTYFGNQANFQLSRWNTLVSLTNANGNGGLFNEAVLATDRKNQYTASLNSNPAFDHLPIGFAVTLAERVFVYRALANGTLSPSGSNSATYASVAPFFLNETFPKNWYRRGTPYTFAQTGADMNAMNARAPTTMGQNQGVGHFEPYDLADATDPSRAACLLTVMLYDLLPGQSDPQVSLFAAFLNATVSPLIKPYGCDTRLYTDPGVNAGASQPGVNTTSNRIVNGVYVS